MKRTMIIYSLLLFVSTAMAADVTSEQIKEGLVAIQQIAENTKPETPAPAPGVLGSDEVIITSEPLSVTPASVIFAGRKFTVPEYVLPDAGSLSDTRGVVRKTLANTTLKAYQLLRGDVKLQEAIGDTPQYRDIEAYRKLFAPITELIEQNKDDTISSGAKEAKAEAAAGIKAAEEKAEIGIKAAEEKAEIGIKAAEEKAEIGIKEAKAESAAAIKAAHARIETVEAKAAKALQLAKAIYADDNFDQAVPLFITYDAGAAVNERFTVHTVTKDLKLADGPEGGLIVPMKWGQREYYNYLFMRGTSRKNTPNANVLFAVRNINVSTADGVMGLATDGPVVELEGKTGHFYVGAAMTPPTYQKNVLKQILMGQLFKAPAEATDVIVGNINN